MRRSKPALRAPTASGINVAHAAAVIACRLPMMDKSPERLMDGAEDTSKANDRNRLVSDIGVLCKRNIRFAQFLTKSGQSAIV